MTIYVTVTAHLMTYCYAIWVFDSQRSFLSRNTQKHLSRFGNKLSIKHFQETEINYIFFRFRVDEEESLFDGFCQTSELSPTSSLFCDCAYGGVGVCGRNRDVFQCGKTDTAQRKQVDDACSKRSCKGQRSKEVDVIVQGDPNLNSQGASQDKGLLTPPAPWWMKVANCNLANRYQFWKRSIFI